MAWWSLDELNTDAPDHHHDSTVDGLASTFDASDELPCFHKEHVLVAEIQQWQLQDDPDAVDSIAKIEEIRGSIRRGTRLPAVVLVHTPKGSLFGGADKARYRGAYHLIEGFHRYNAAYREREQTLFAWVAHIGCCDGPEADYEPYTDAE